MLDKFIVIKRDFTQLLTKDMQISLDNILKWFDTFRRVAKKEYKYIVINMDEPYINDIIKVLKDNNHWEGEFIMPPIPMVRD